MSKFNEDTLKCEMAEDDILYFLHIRKAAGSTLNQILDDQYPEEQCFPHHISNARRNLDVVMDALKQDSQQFKIFKGHYPCRVHELLHRKPIYITMLRQPVSRFISLYYFIKSRSVHPLNELTHEYPLSEFVWLPEVEKRAMWNNGQTHQILSGQYNRRKTPKEKVLSLLREKLINDFAFFGLQERFNESLFLLAHTLDWNTIPEPKYLNINYLEEYKDRPEITDRTRQRIIELNEMDLQLYSFAKEQFEARIERLIELRGDELKQYLMTANHASPLTHNLE